MHNSLIVFAFLLSISSVNSQFRPFRNRFGNLQLVNTSRGQVQGRQVRTDAGNVAYVYQNIPYAQPPIGPLRFARTVSPAADWTPRVLDGTAYGAACMSNSSFTTSPQSPISEDCLTVNVFSGRRCRLGLVQCPVLLYIHGGAWEFDSPRMFPPEVLIDNFASNGLVFVTVGYRLGVFGYWATPNGSNTTTRGNYAIYDLIASLEWVQREISAFGGDASQVSIMGHSSGATATSLLSVLPAVQGLFQQVIEMSGGILQDKDEIYSPKDNADKSAAFTIHLNCSTQDQWDSNTDWQSILQCMRNATPEQLIEWQRAFEESSGEIMFAGPSVDGELIPDYPSKLALNRTALRFMIGGTSNESGVYLPENTTIDVLQTLCAQTAAADQSISHPQIVTDQCVQQYSILGVSEGVSQLASDQFSNLGTAEEAASIRAAGGQVYLYSFDYEREPGQGLGHAQDLTYVVGVHPFQYDTNDSIIAQTYPALFANFAKSGNPTANLDTSEQWQVAGAANNYYSIGLQSNNEPAFHGDSVNFWTKTVPAIDQGAQLEDQALGITPSSTQPPVTDSQGQAVTDSEGAPVTSGPGTDWRVAFWVTLAVALLLLLLLLGACIYWCCTKHNKQTDPERTPLIDPKKARKSEPKASNSGTQQEDTPKQETKPEERKNDGVNAEQKKEQPKDSSPSEPKPGSAQSKEVDKVENEENDDEDDTEEEYDEAEAEDKKKSEEEAIKNE